jgi:S1-C subfamily serine protease
MLSAILVLAAAGFVFYNTTRPVSQEVVNDLAAGTVTVRAMDREGTGTLVMVDDGWRVITAAHVVAGNQSVDVIGRDGARQTARLQSVDNAHDVAFADVRAGKDWRPLRIAGGLPYPGQKVSTQCFFDAAPRDGIFAGSVDDVRIGSIHIPQLNLAEVLGSITQLHPSPGQSILALFAVEPGCSGAPLLNQDGEVIGIVVAGNDKTLIASSAVGLFP